MVESSLVKTVCSDCSCGFCCFFGSNFDGFMLDSYNNITEKGDERGTNVITELPRGNDLSSIISKYYPARIDKRGEAYFTRPNKDIGLIVKNFFPLYACSLLDVEVKDGAAEKLSCLIHSDDPNSDFRNTTCRNFNSGMFSPCFPTLKLNVLGIKVNGETYRLNDKVLELINSYSFS
jgi:hypothetical protein